MSNFKSVTAVNTTNGWAVCQTNDDGTELFVLPDIFEPKLTEEHAQQAANYLRIHLEGGGKTYAKPLPDGVNVVS